MWLERVRDRIPGPTATPQPWTEADGAKGLWNDGWWQVEHAVGGGNDSTTWKVEILGNPLHLVIPD